MNNPAILVTGATGNVGRPLTASLLAEGARVRALTRNPETAGFPPEVEVAGGDYSAPATFAGAVAGTDALFVNIGAIRTGLGDLLAAARDAGVRKIVMLSSTTVRDDGEQMYALGASHKMAEDAGGATMPSSLVAGVSPPVAMDRRAHVRAVSLLEDELAWVVNALTVHARCHADAVSPRLRSSERLYCRARNRVRADYIIVALDRRTRLALIVCCRKDRY